MHVYDTKQGSFLPNLSAAYPATIFLVYLFLSNKITFNNY